MKIYAQHGAQTGEKINLGLEQSLLDGVIYSPKDISLANLKQKIKYVDSNFDNVDQLLDPQYYAALIKSDAARLGNLIKDYATYFSCAQRSHLERERSIERVLSSSIAFQRKLNLTGIIAPNILIPNSLNSIEAVIAKNFIRQTGSVAKKFKVKTPIYATLAIARDALMNIQEINEFLNDITMLDDPPDGYYIIVQSRSSDARSDIYNADVIAAWMLLNYSLSVNGFEVINGYSDLLTPLLCSVGGAAGSTGWWTNLRVFSLGRFMKSKGGGRLPIQRYLSCILLNRITFYELNSLREILPGVMNDLETDDIYDINRGSEPERNKEVLQSWEALGFLLNKVSAKDIKKSLLRLQKIIKDASIAYKKIELTGVTLDSKSNDEHLEPLLEGIKLFCSSAEIKLSQ
ncbi:MAG: hypothetical protein KC900_08815 [Candidatus Omnitrophica bacterium]|nr:hypothetical protein [Candidatus Omnitrophota bacterium]